MLQFFKSRTYTFHPQIVIKTFEGNGKNLSIVIKTFERTGKSLPPSIISKEDERSMSQGRISEGDTPPVQQENNFNSIFRGWVREGQRCFLMHSHVHIFMLTQFSKSS